MFEKCQAVSHTQKQKIKVSCSQLRFSTQKDKKKSASVFLLQISHPGRWSGPGSSNLALRDRRVVRGLGAAHGGDLSNHPYHCVPLHGRASDRHTAREDRHHQGVMIGGQSAARIIPLNLASSSAQPAPTPPVQLQVSHLNLNSNQCPDSCSDSGTHTPPPSLSSKQPEGVSSSSESLTPGGAKRGGIDQHPPSLIPRAVGASAYSSLHSLASRGSPSRNNSSSEQTSPTPPTASSTSSTSSTFTGRLGQPPRGPLSLHSYSRKNVFLQHSLHTAELQALTQRDT